jgi:hypothetical protein
LNFYNKEGKHQEPSEARNPRIIRLRGGDAGGCSEQFLFILERNNLKRKAEREFPISPEQEIT